jgi:exodeoxyribonuclease-3
MAKTIVSYNVNGIRAAAKKGLVDWLQEGDYDILCVQETKAHQEQVDVTPFERLGYHHHWYSAEKKGYSGVATFSKQAPDNVVTGCGIEKYDREGRILRTDFGDLSILNCYFPSGTSGDERQAFKMDFLADFSDWVAELRKERPKLLILGDYNIAHTPIDIHDPVRNKKSSGFLPEEREWLSKWFDNGFVDSYRHLNAEKIEYSWWSYRAGARANNKGWRIDYQSVTENLKDNLKQAHHIGAAKHSDHCPVFLEIDL